MKLALFDNGDPEEFLLFIRNFNMTIDASEKIVPSAKIKYFCMLVHEEDLCRFDMFSTEVGSTTSENLKSIILGLGTYFFLLIRCKKREQCAAEQGSRAV